MDRISQIRERSVLDMKLKNSLLIPIFLFALLLCSVSLLEACGKKEKQETGIEENETEIENHSVELDENKDIKGEDSSGTNLSDEETVKDVVTRFGSKLQNVSLLADKKDVKKAMEENYKEFVTEDLLDKWMEEPGGAPGRLTSSPWPDRIEISGIKKLKDDSYQVKGEIIEITSEEKDKNEAASKRSISLILKKVNDRWLIDDVTLGSYQNSNEILYENKEYGFRFHLPKSWKGYKIIEDKWEGMPVGETDNNEPVESGPMISIRHPKWTKEEERQDIPIMIFTHEQWDALQKDEFHIGAAPINPSELGRNSRYVFALPARYNFAFPAGYEEVEEILQGKPLEPTEDFKKAE